MKSNIKIEINNLIVGFLHKFSFLRVFNSPFIRPKVKFYCGKLFYGTPIFYPRKWVKNSEKPGYTKAIPKKIGFDFVGLGYKTKWSDTDYRYEWGPIWSFVFFKWQFCILFEPPHPYNYWESWLYYDNDTDKTKSKKERIQESIKGFPQIYTQHSKDGEKTIDYYPLILKQKYLN